MDKAKNDQQGEIVPGQDTPQIAELMMSVQKEIQQFRELMKIRIQDILNSLAGCSFSGLAERQQIAKQVRELLDLAGLRLKCPHCGQPATIRSYDLRSGSRHGSFQFEHVGGRPTRHGGLSAFPSDLTLVEKPRAKRPGRSPSSNQE